MKHLSDAMAAHILAGKLIAEAAWKLALKGDHEITTKKLLEEAIIHADKPHDVHIGAF